MEKVLTLGDKKDIPVWRLCQWATRYSLAKARPKVHANGDVSYKNRGKIIIAGGDSSPNRDLVLGINGSAEYDGIARKFGEPWPHLLVEQDAASILPLTSLEKLRLRIYLKLISVKNYMKDNYDPRLHAAQFQMFFIVKNINKSSKDYLDYFWFGVPFFDSRHDIPPSYRAKDGGKASATGKFIYTVDGKEFSRTPLKNHGWIYVRKDLLPYIKKGLQCAVKRRYLENADPKNYAVVNMNLGWEIPGIFDAQIQVKDLEVLAFLKK